MKSQRAAAATNTSQEGFCFDRGAVSDSRLPVNHKAIMFDDQLGTQRPPALAIVLPLVVDRCRYTGPVISSGQRLSL